jgi:hypothetical protein
MAPPIIVNIIYLFNSVLKLKFFIWLACKSRTGNRNGIILVCLHDNFRNAVFNGRCIDKGVDAEPDIIAININNAPIIFVLILVYYTCLLSFYFISELWF